MNNLDTNNKERERESCYTISVIIPTFNAEKYIKRAINSVINQTIGFENIELIIVDDNSIDNTKQILKNFSKQYENIKSIFLKTNSGNPSKPRNIGIESANSNYIMFLDDDDKYDKEVCEKLYNKAINDETLDFVACGLFLEKDEIINFNYNDLDFIKFEGNYSNSEWKSPDRQQWLVLFSICNKIFKKSFLIDNNIRFSKYRHEDANFMMICFIKVYSFAVFNSYIGYFITVRPDSRSRNFTPLKHLDIIQGVLFTYRNYLRKEDSNTKKFYFDHYSPSFLVSHFLFLRYDDFKKVYSECIPIFKEGIKLSKNRSYFLIIRTFSLNYYTAIFFMFLFQALNKVLKIK
ncbi:MAG: glycosyltransferase family 2 protein [Methanobrevibacter sp.]|jgi:glycosyltransferase involved in cell wall biosynthesis|nr:glycosyltransferase family 2 protein [Candidatus Methanovirga australis]